MGITAMHLVHLEASEGVTMIKKEAEVHQAGAASAEEYVTPVTLEDLKKDFNRVIDDIHALLPPSPRLALAFVMLKVVIAEIEYLISLRTGSA